MIPVRFTGAFLGLAAALLFLPQVLFSQTTPPDTSRKVIQFSGLVIDRDSLTALPYVAVIVRNSERGVYSNFNGYYSIVVQENDTVDFYQLGYHKATYIIPDTFTTSAYNHVQTMQLDTILLHEAVIYPWPSKDKFKDAFLNTSIPSDDLDRARANLARADMVQRAQNVAMDAGMASSSVMSQHVARNYYAGQAPPNNLLNPVAWARFIESMKR